MKDFIFLQKKIELFYDKITKKRNMNEEMRIQKTENLNKTKQKG